MKVYVASSWRNSEQPAVVAALRADGHDVYDFRHPRPDNDGFRWEDVDRNWKTWTADQYIAGVKHPIARRSFGFDSEALRNSDVCVLLLPCGRSAHLEAGWAAGAGKLVYVITQDGEEPELMNLLATAIVPSVSELQKMLGKKIISVTDSQRILLRHALGLSGDGDHRTHRDHLVLCRGRGETEDAAFDDCMELTAAGLMWCCSETHRFEGGHCFVVTENGKRFAGVSNEA